MQKAPSIEAEFHDMINMDEERIYWIEISELDCIKVIRYMLEFSKKDDEWNTHEKFLKGWLQDCINQARFEKICNKHNYDEKFYV